MHRRTLLLGVPSVVLPGCVGRGSDDSTPPEAHAPDRDGEGEWYDGLVVSEVRPREVERDYVDYEYVELSNEASVPIDVSGAELRYGDDASYALPELELEPGASLVVLSRSSEETTLTTDPPVYVRSAGFGPGPETSVLDGTGVVRLASPSGTPIYEKRYSEASDATTAPD